MNETIISFTHSNYCIRSAGTEKYVRGISQILLKGGFHHLNFFSFYDKQKRMRTKMVGVNLDDEFIGIYNYNDILSVINMLSVKRNLIYTSIHIQHLLNHDLEVVKSIVNVLKVPVFVIIHDFYLVCPGITLINSEGEFCGISLPTEHKCKNCALRNLASKHRILINDFIKNIDTFVKYYITPSDFVTNNIKRVFTNIADKVITRGHVLTKGINHLNPIEGKIKLAFAGAQNKDKGFEKWNQLVDVLSKDFPDEYEFFYLGNGLSRHKNVKNIFVSVAHQGDNAMIKAAKNYGIDCAFMWSEWPETYSYVYFELAVNGIYILTSDDSGNIACMVENNKNGHVFENFDDAVRALMNPTAIKNEINLYRMDGEYRPTCVVNNDSLDDLVDTSLNKYSNNNTVKLRKAYVHTILYIIKHRKLLYKEDVS